MVVRDWWARDMPVAKGVSYGGCENGDGDGRGRRMRGTFGFEARVCEVGGFRTGFADFELGFLEVGFLGGLFACGGTHFLSVGAERC